MTRDLMSVAGPDDGLDGAVVELTVGPLAHGGHCVARLPASGEGESSGRVVFVRHALPGERVRAVVTEEHGDYLRAEAVEILDASPRRITPPCPWAGPGRCGGCDLQHAELGYQRELKAAVVREQLVRLGGLSPSTVDSLDLVVRSLPPVPGEPDGLGWRTRVQYTVDSTGRAGLRAHRSHEVVPVDRCLIAHATIRAADVLSRDWPEHQTVEVVAGEPATVLARRDGRLGGEGGHGIRHSAPPVVVSGSDTVTERAAGRSWRLPPSAFWQVHPSAADTLATAVVELLAPRPGDRIWDLYGGAGLFAAALSPHADASGRITVVEADAAAAAAARENLRDLTTVTVVHADVARVLRRRHWRAVDLVVLDPPRSGAGRAVVSGVASRGPRAVAYVACDPAALARDVRTFRAQGYELAVLRAYDLFPQTHHVECVALLIRS